MKPSPETSNFNLNDLQFKLKPQYTHQRKLLPVKRSCGGGGGGGGGACHAFVVVVWSGGEMLGWQCGDAVTWWRGGVVVKGGWTVGRKVVPVISRARLSAASFGFGS